MPSVSLLFVLSQILLSAGVYRLADRYDASSPLLAAASILLVGVAIVVLVDRVVVLLVVEILLVVAYFVGLNFGRDRQAAT